MSSSNSIIKPGPLLVADASVVINLNATNHAERIIAALPHPFAVMDNALQELLAGARNGHRDGEWLTKLIEDGVIELKKMGNTGIYETLIDGSAGRTLDDGEAATISYAHEIGGIALIDERKARNLCADRFSALPIMATVEILLHDAVATELGKLAQIECMLNALREARMRVPPELIMQVVSLIGEENAVSCRSLPRSLRAAS